MSDTTNNPDPNQNQDQNNNEKPNKQQGGKGKKEEIKNKLNLKGANKKEPINLNNNPKTIILKLMMKKRWDLINILN